MISLFFFSGGKGKYLYLYKEIESCYQKNKGIFKGEGYTGNENVEMKES